MNSDENWREKLSKEEYDVLREKGTERPFTGKLLHNKKTGVYVCTGCGKQLFKSDAKFDSGTGWPSFSESIKNRIKFKKDFSLGIPRTEVICKSCGGHLGHVFEHPKSESCPTGKRYCINSIALNFKEKSKKNVD